MSQALGGDSPNAQQAPGAGAPAPRKQRKARAKSGRKAGAKAAREAAAVGAAQQPAAGAQPAVPATRRATGKRKASAKRKNAAAAPRATPITTTAPGRWTFGMAVSYLEGVAATLITSHQLKGSIQIVGKIAA